MDTMTHQDAYVTLGIDTHADLHVAAALDRVGKVLGTIVIPTTTEGYNQLLEWASMFGVIDKIGVEGTGAWGARLTRWLQGNGLVVVEVDRADRKARRLKGKSDVQDAINAARMVLSEQATGVPKSRDGNVEMIRVIKVARRSALKARTQTANQLHALVVTAPEELHDRLRDLSLRQLVDTAARFRPGDRPDDPDAATRFTMRSLARRWRELTAELKELDAQLERLVGQTAPELVERHGIGTQSAAQLLITAGDNPQRLDHEGSFAHLCGTAPLPATSGQRQDRHRLNIGGDRLANAALHMIAVTRLRTEQRTKDYVKRKRKQGKTDREIMRCLKRYIAREAYRILRDLPALQAA